MKGQVWSFEMIITLTFFTVIFVAMVTFLVARSNPDITETQSRAQIISDRLLAYETTGGSVAFVESGIVNSVKLDDFAKKDHSILQRELGISGDFCVYFEDENGELIPFDVDTYGIGSSNIRFVTTEDDYDCGTLP